MVPDLASSIKFTKAIVPDMASSIKFTKAIVPDIAYTLTLDSWYHNMEPGVCQPETLVTRMERKNDGVILQT